MAKPTCQKCGGNEFELYPFVPKDSKEKLRFVICSKCGFIVGCLENENIGELLGLHFKYTTQEIRKVLQKIKQA